MTVLERLGQDYEKLSASEKKIADYILKNPENAVNCNVSELANNSNTSDATIIRFSKHVGDNGYYQLRITLSRELGHNDKVQMQSDQSSGPDIFCRYAENIKNIGTNALYQRIKKCTYILENCNTVHVIAVGNTCPLAQYTGFRLARLGIRATYHSLPEYFLNDVVMAEKDDVVFAISQSGTSVQVVKALEIAVQKKVTTMAVVGNSCSSVSRLSDYILGAVVQGQSFDYHKNHSHLYEMAAIDALLEQITCDAKKENLNADLLEMVASNTKM